jgi:hypothetical protein
MPFYSLRRLNEPLPGLACALLPSSKAFEALNRFFPQLPLIS